MDVSELKSMIESGSYDGSFMIWKLEDSSSMFLARMYYRKIADNSGMSVKLIDTEDEIMNEGFAVNSILYVKIVDKLEEYAPNDNYVIICNSTKNKDAITIPKVEPWMIIDYEASVKVPGLNKHDVEWLAQIYTQTDSRVTKLNYERLDNDLDKISIFDVNEQASVFDFLYNAGEYSTISNLTIFDLTNALMTHNKKEALEVLKVYDYIDSQPHVWLLKILINSVRIIIGIQSGETAKDLGISDGRYYAVKKNNCGVYNISQLKSIYKTLTDAEYMYKFGGLSMDHLSDYLICKIMIEGCR